jgi:threonine synthase
VSLATAHPAKFSTTVEHATGREIPMPPQLLHYLKGTRRVTPINNGYTSFKRYLLQFA